MFNILLLFTLIIKIHARFDTDLDIECIGEMFKNVTLTAYYPDYANYDNEFGYQDKKGRKLRTLQDYLDDRAKYVTFSMDEALNIPYGTEICIPELNQHYGHRIRLEVRDTSFDLYGMGYSNAEICVRSEIDSYDISVNRPVTIVFA